MFNIYIENSEKYSYYYKITFVNKNRINIKLYRNISYSESKLTIIFLDTEAFRDKTNAPIDSLLKGKLL